jgi:hypothetical protein
MAINAAPEGYAVTVDGKRAEVSFGPADDRTSITVAVEGDDLILFPDRSYKQAELARLLDLKG